MRAALLQTLDREGLDVLAEVTRVREQVIPGYVKIGPAAAPTLRGILQTLEAAALAVQKNDGELCLRLLRRLRGIR